MKFRVLIAVLGMGAFAALAHAEDGAKLFGTKCAGCHGPNGAGKAAMKGTNLLSPEAKKKTDAELSAAITDGGATKKATHAFGKKGVSPDQVTALVAHIRTLQK